MALPQIHGEFADLAARLSGRTLHVPNLKMIFSGWPAGTNARLGDLRNEIDGRMLGSGISDPNRVQKYKRADFGLLTSVWFPDVNQWTGPRFILFLVPSQKKYLTTKLPPSLAQRELVYREFELYMLQVSIESNRRQDGRIPTPEEYMRTRFGTSAVTTLISFIDYMNGITLPQWVMESKEMEVIWNETCTLCYVVNDIYSFKEELDDGALQNLIPVIFHANGTGDLEDTMRDILQMAHTSREAFDKASDSLLNHAEGDKQLNKDIGLYSNTCRTFVTGLMHWSLESKRYGLRQYKREDTSLIIPL
ncbi:isoprenoid synthase domain-containing protein [Hypoxylon crocopeplum]|nr:isoprenoid synthase domain-containing protein [Hypoxylon crocopeplum]